MEKSQSIAALAEALSKFQGEVGAAIKSTKNDFLNRKYATISDIWDTIRVPLVENGLSVTQVCEESIMTTRVDKFTTPESDAISVFEKPILMVSVTTVLLHKSGEWISGKLTIPAHKEEKKELKIDPQAAGSAITYARRYALASILGITQEDDDGQGYQKTTRSTPTVNAETGESEPAQEATSEDAAMPAKRKELLALVNESPLKPEVKKALVEGVKASVNSYDIGILTAKFELLVAKYHCTAAMKQLVDGKVDRYDTAERRKESCMKHLNSLTITDASDIDKVEAYRKHLIQVFKDKDKPKEAKETKKGKGKDEKPDPETEARAVIDALPEGYAKTQAEACWKECLTQGGGFEFITETDWSSMKEPENETENL